MKKFTFLMIALFIAAMGFAQTKNSGAKMGPYHFMKPAKQINHSTRATRAVVFSEDFESNGLPTGWTVLDADGDGYNWETLATTNEAFASGYGHNSDGAVVSWSYYPTSQSSQGWSGNSLNTNDYLITPQITVPSGDSKLVFYVASFNGSDYPDDIEVKISTTGTAAADFTTLIANETVTASIPNFAERNVSLNAYAGQQVYIAFVHQSNDCFAIVLDDVSVMEITANDIAVTDVELTAESGCGLTTTNAVVTLTNNGTAAISAFTLAYTINGGTPVSENVTADIAAGATYEYTFENINISAEGNYTIEVTATLENDGNTADNTKSATISHLAPATIPYTNTFDSDEELAGLSLINANADGVRWSIYYVDENNQDDLWPGIQTYNASAGNDDYFVTSCINIEAGTYILSADVLAGYAAYNYSEDFSIVYGTAPTAEALTNVIYQATEYIADEETLVSEFTVAADGTYYIAFRVTSQSGAQFLINNLRITTPPTTPEIELNSISIADGATYVAGNNITLAGVVKNNGIDLTSYKVAYTVDGGTPVEYAVSGINVALGATHNFTHETPIVLEAGNHAIAVTVSEPNGVADGDASDNTITVNVTVIDCDAISELPYTQDFENGLTACWGTISNNTANASGTYGFGIYDMEGNKVFRFSSYSSADDYNQYLITPEIAITAAATLSFDYAARYDDEPESFRVMVSTTDNNIASFSAIGETVNTETDQFTPFSVTIPANTKYIAINYFSEYSYYLYIDNLALNTITSAEENIADAIAVYPNPTSSMVTIANAEGKDIIVVNSLGQVVASIENAAANQTIDVANFANGTYFVKVDGEVVKLNVVK